MRHVIAQSLGYQGSCGSSIHIFSTAREGERIRDFHRGEVFHIPVLSPLVQIESIQQIAACFEARQFLVGRFSKKEIAKWNMCVFS